MNEEQIRAMIQAQLEASVAGVLDTLTSHFDTQFGSIKQQLEAAGQPQGTAQGKPEAGKNSLTDRLAVLEQRLEQEKKARVEAEQRQAQAERDRQFDSEFDKVIGAYNVQPELRQFLVKTLKSELGSAELVGNAFIKDGKDLSEYISDFMSSPVGKHFQPPSGNHTGSGSQTTQDKAGLTGQGSEQDVCNALMF